MSRNSLFKPFFIRWSRILGIYLLVVVSVQAVLYLTIKEDTAIDFTPFTDLRWALHGVESIAFGGPQYRLLTWFSVVCTGLIAALNLIKPCRYWINLYLITETIFILPNVILTILFLMHSGPLANDVVPILLMWMNALVMSLIPMAQALFIVGMSHVS